MDSTQLLLSVAITITTIVIIGVGLQIIALIKDIRYVVNNENKANHYHKHEIKKMSPKGNLLSALSLLDKIKNMSVNHKDTKKKFFVKKS